MNRTKRLGLIFGLVFSVFSFSIARGYDCSVQDTSMPLPIPQSECETLEQLYLVSNGSGWTDTTNWFGSGTSPCSWYGVSCGSTGIQSIDLSSNNLSGTIYVSGLTYLQTLDLSDNKISSLSANAFDGLTSLDSLLLINNPVQTPSTINLSALTLSSLICPTNYTETTAEQECTANSSSLEASPSSLDLGTVDVGSTATGTIQLINSGTAVINFSGDQYLSGASEFSVLSDACGSTLSAGTSCDIVVEFSPSSSGAFSSVLVAESDAGSQTVSIQGVSNEPQTVLNICAFSGNTSTALSSWTMIVAQGGFVQDTLTTQASGCAQTTLPYGTYDIIQQTETDWTFVSVLGVDVISSTTAQAEIDVSSASSRVDFFNSYTPAVAGKINITFCKQDDTLADNLANASQGWHILAYGYGYGYGFDGYLPVGGCTTIADQTGNIDYAIWEDDSYIPGHLSISDSSWQYLGVSKGGVSLGSSPIIFLTGGASYTFTFTNKIVPVDGVWGTETLSSWSTCSGGIRVKTGTKACLSGAKYGGTGCTDGETIVTTYSEACTVIVPTPPVPTPAPVAAVSKPKKKTKKTSHRSSSPALVKDYCPQGDYSSNYYDKDCGEAPESKIDIQEIQEDEQKEKVPALSCSKKANTNSSNYSNEVKEAYQYAYCIGSTDKDNIAEARLQKSLKRKEYAKMVAEFAMQRLDMEPDYTRKCEFSDMEDQAFVYQKYTRLACQLGIMGLKSDGEVDSTFRPDKYVDRAMVATTLSRMLFGDTYNRKSKEWYKEHLYALKKSDILTHTSEPRRLEKRGYALLMLYRADQKRNKRNDLEIAFND